MDNPARRGGSGRASDLDPAGLCVNRGRMALAAAGEENSRQRDTVAARYQATGTQSPLYFASRPVAISGAVPPASAAPI